MNALRICVALLFIGLMTGCGTGHSKGMLLLNKRDDVDKYNPADGILAFIPVSNGDYSYTVSLMNYDNGKVYMMPLEGVSVIENLSITVFGVDVYRSSGADTCLRGSPIILYSLPKGRYELLRVSAQGERHYGYPRNGSKQARFKTKSDTILIESARITDLGALYVGIKENFIGYPNDVEVKTIGNIKNSSFEAIRDERIRALPVSHVTFAAEKLKR